AMAAVGRRESLANASGLPQKMSTVTQKGPAFFDRTFSAMSATRMANLRLRQAESGQRRLEPHHVVQREFIERAAVRRGRGIGKGEGRQFLVGRQRMVQNEGIDQLADL